MSDLLPKNQVFINMLTEIIVANLRNENFGVNDLARGLGISRYRLSLRLQAITNKTINQFIRETRLRKAMEMLINEEVSASDVAYKVGFSSPAYFNTCFHEFYGFPPGKVKTLGTKILEEEVQKPISALEKRKRPARRSVIFTLSGISILVVLAVIVISLVRSKIYNRSNLEKLISSGERISIAVMPFQNLINDSIRYGEIIQISLTSFLSGYTEELKVEQPESVNGILTSEGLTNYASVTPSMAISAARKLNANIFVFGDIIKSGNVRRFYAQLTDTKTKEVIKSFQVEGSLKEEGLLQILDSINKKVGNYLLISKLKRKNIEFEKVTTTNSAQAYTYYLKGKDAYYSMRYSDAINWFQKALTADTNFTWTMRFLAASNNNNGDINEARKWSLKFYSKKEMMNEYQRLYADYGYANTFLTPNESIAILKRLLLIDEQPPVYRSLGAKYFNLQQYDKAIPELIKALDIYKKWGSKPLGYDFYSFLATAYHESGQYKKEKKLYRKSERDFPDNIYMTGRQAILALTEKDTVTANKFIEKYRSILKGNSATEANITGDVGGLYREANLPDKAEKYFREALRMDPQNILWLNNLAYLLINTGRNISEGMDIAEKVLVIDTANIRALRIKGWGLYKLGKNQEALDLLQKCWNTKLYGYNHSELLHLEEVRKAVEEHNFR
ncbi:MAG: helix-turn-helix domain-containing protein [Bacteroidia bacterium]|nr:helix-turn-helix domain-containing protein [Bacteroidia bacterium]